MTIKALLFDLDGTLIDSMPHHESAWVDFHQKRDLPFEADAFFKATAGRDNHEILGDLLPGLERHEYDTMAHEKEAVYRQIAASRLELIPGFEPLRAARGAGMKLAICTASTPENMRLAFGRFGLDTLVDTVTSPADGLRGKPHPDIFLEAARRLGIDPADCVVFEDAPLGVEAARRAGMHAVALTTSLPAEAFAAYDNLLAVAADLRPFDLEDLAATAAQKNKESPMREGNAIVVRRENYTAPAFWIRTVELTFDLDPTRTVVRSRLQMERNLDVPPRPLELQGEELTPLSVLANGASVSFRHEGGLLVIDSLPDGPFTLEIKNTCSPEQNTRLTGLYTSGGGFFTQCEAEGFRRITYFLDRPDVMAVYTVTLRADRAKYPVLLSNGNLLEQGPLDNGRHFAKWHDPFPKPSYLFALVAADLVWREQKINTRSGKQHLLQVYVRRGDLEKTEHAMNSLIASVVWDEARFKLPLDLERFMIVAVGDFNMGAMENKGLNIFNTAYVLANPATATDTDYAGIESVVGHEYFHNWTGNRITCRDWFQLSLKEGLTVFRDQEFSMDMAGTPTARAVKRIEDVRQLRAMQFPEDAGPMAHPVRPDQYVEINNFYTATVYEKGSEVVRMMQTLVGREGFERGISLYFQRFDGQAVTCDDFAQAIADANPESPLASRLEQFKRWYSQDGTPRVAARGRYDEAARSYTLSFDQHGVPSLQQPNKLPYVIPVAMGLIDRNDGRALPLQLEGEAEAGGTDRVLVLDQGSSSFTFVNVDAAPVPSLMRGFSAPVVLVDDLGDAQLFALLKHDSDPFNRWEAGQRLALQRLLAAIRDGASTLLDDAYIAAMRDVLRHPQLDAAFKELVLTLPSEGYLAEQLEIVDPQRIHAVRQSMQLQLAQSLRDDWAWAFDEHQVKGGYSPDPVSSGRRALANLALGMLCLDAAERGDAVQPGRAYQRFKEAGNMTDRLGALNALVESHSELAVPALERFHAIFKDEALVIDKWFALQAKAPEKDGRMLGKVLQLMKHPDFSLRNPNRARSLINSYCRFNPAGFHRADGAGYAFWADRVLELDAINPQLGARIARVMDRWTQLDEPYRSAAREAIARVAAKPGLSSDVREIVERALHA